RRGNDSRSWSEAAHARVETTGCRVGDHRQRRYCRALRFAKEARTKSQGRSTDLFIDQRGESHACITKLEPLRSSSRTHGAHRSELREINHIRIDDQESPDDHRRLWELRGVDHARGDLLPSDDGKGLYGPEE